MFMSRRVRYVTNNSNDITYFFVIITTTRQETGFAISFILPIERNQKTTSQQSNPMRSMYGRAASVGATVASYDMLGLAISELVGEV
jgi:hypothetical protein